VLQDRAGDGQVAGSTVYVSSSRTTRGWRLIYYYLRGKDGLVVRNDNVIMEMQIFWDATPRRLLDIH
jgi:hypothetical protein